MGLFLLTALGVTAVQGLAGLLVARATLGRPLLSFPIPGRAMQGPTAAGQEADADDGLHLLAHAALWAFLGVPALAFWLHLLTRVQMGMGLVLLSAAVHAGLALAWRSGESRRGSLAGHWLGAAELGQAWRERRGVVLAACAVAAVWFLRHPSGVPPGSCVADAAQVALGWHRWPIDLLREDLSHSALGAAAVVSSSLASWGLLGNRVLHGVLGLCLALGGWLIGAAIDRHSEPQRPALRWWGLAVAGLNPWALSIPLIDENLLTYGFSIVPLAAIALRFSQPPGLRSDAAGPQASWWAIGWLLGLCMAIRHPLVLGVPALVWLAWHGASGTSGRWRPVAAVLLGLLGATLLEHLHHLLAFRSLLRFESNVAYLPQPYRLFGVEFHWGGMVNWPIHDTLVRTPHNPLPMLVMWPLVVARWLGSVLVGVTLLGAWAAWRRDRRLAVGWLLWLVPMSLSLLL